LDLAKFLALSVKIDSVRTVLFSIISLFTIENAVRTDREKPKAEFF